MCVGVGTIHPDLLAHSAERKTGVRQMVSQENIARFPKQECRPMPPLPTPPLPSPEYDMYGNVRDDEDLGSGAYAREPARYVFPQ